MAVPTTFINLQLTDIIEDAFERCLVNLQTVGSYGLASAMRSIKLIFAEWSQQVTIPWQLVEYTQTPSTGNSFVVPTDCVDIISAQSVDVNGFTYRMQPILRQEYFQLTDKNTNGLPTSWFFNQNNRTLYFYPGIEGTTYNIRFTYIQRLFDYEFTGQELNVQYAFWEALTSALAAKLGAKLKTVDNQRLVYLETKAKLAFDTAIINMNANGIVYIGPS